MFTLECCQLYVNENLHFKSGKYSPVMCMYMVLVVLLYLKDFSRREHHTGFTQHCMAKA